ncbi:MULTISPECIES: PspC domain-containing protein [Arcicella]|uniref:PspC domain-containing protein n=1 Tax=Arcicella aquatica TaxID=217141 RepID=A0ABU5QRD0_9BACT|nr:MULTISPECIES: PspC domain-containing protein [Arcicella]MDR6562715.1 phage shock protein PspC (stress-responsive transcriptional regulator) [Arcicella sp. BE51]MDR6812940.1 phage shock protein PspC (stress-responsive transcriptional regulator) [Arcicella sp. BE140]MDR6824254.1 phage shock protein PspC (stress-responsive transcriptional regulator) [Arcicella sp. BE139]MEA5259299.1 PspC domain-containing protein [Arcicella aquatica]
MNDSLYRIPSKGQLGGVAAGLAERFGFDVSIVRLLLFLGLIFTHGIFFWMYIILWIALPVKHQWETTSTPEDSNFNSTTFTNMKKDSSKVWGIILIVLGTIFLLDEWIPDFDFGKFWPLILIGVGGYIIFKEKDKINFNNDNDKTNF